jgi:hypothetical protein
MVQYYGEAAQIQEEQAKASATALSVRSLLVNPGSDSWHPYFREIPRTVPARLVLFIIRHPVASSLGFVAFCLAGLLALSQLTFKHGDLNPFFAKRLDEFLVAYNKDGGELWRKYIGPEYSRDLGQEYDPNLVLSMGDVDNSGTNEIIGVFGWMAPSMTWRNAVVCFRSDGNVRWTYSFHRHMVFGEEAVSDDYGFRMIVVDDYDQDAKLDVIAIAQHDPYYPTAIVRLDASTGALVSEYWHSGWIQSILHADINGDGIEELLFGGENNGLNAATLLVLDPRRMTGHSPPSSGFIPGEVQPGSEMYYLLLPHSGLEVARLHPRGSVKFLAMTGDRLLRVALGEVILSSNYVVADFYFDQSMRCTRVGQNDDFVALHRSLEAEGKIKTNLDTRYYEELRGGVQYWDGDKFVNNSTMNRRYTEALYPQ